MKITQEIVDEIVQRARLSTMGLGDPEKGSGSYDISKYDPPNLETLALMLVSAHTAKYDIVSVMAAALEVVTEKLQARAGICPHCDEVYQHDHDEPFADCGCGTTEWAYLDIEKEPLSIQLSYYKRLAQARHDEIERLKAVAAEP